MRNIIYSMGVLVILLDLDLSSLLLLIGFGVCIGFYICAFFITLGQISRTRGWEQRSRRFIVFIWGGWIAVMFLFGYEVLGVGVLTGVFASPLGFCAGVLGICGFAMSVYSYLYYIRPRHQAFSFKFFNRVLGLPCILMLIMITPIKASVIWFVTLISLDTLYYLYVTAFVMYFAVGAFLFFSWGLIGVRGIFYLAEFTIMFFMIFTGILICINIRTHTAILLNLGTIQISDGLCFCCHVEFDLLSLLCAGLVSALTLIILIFGIEYMTREALAYNVVCTLVIFSACIVGFFIAYAFGIMMIFWELSGIFSLLLVDMYYARIRTTQAVSRSYAITRFSDMCAMLVSSEAYALCGNDTFSALFAILPIYSFSTNILFSAFVDVTSATFIFFIMFIMTGCKCAQFLVFVWLPDAMEAPTPASALIHSSTLVVMGIYLLLRVSPILHLSFDVLMIIALVGSLTTLYGSVCSIQTSDLKKAIAYSTISQIGYMFCGCGVLAYREVLLYLVVHALCKAMLFVFVGYLVHMFGGTTSLRRMGGVFYIIPDTATYMFIICLILAGAPYTLGYYAKDLLVMNVFSSSTLLTWFMRCCWIVAFFCTPIYLHRVCIITLFGRPRCSRRTYRNILSLTETMQHHSLYLFNLTKLNNKVLLFFSKQARSLHITGPLASILHFIIIALILFCGEWLIMLLGGFFNTSTLLFSNTAQDLISFGVVDLQVQSQYLVRNIILLIFILFSTVVVYYIFLNNQSHFNVFMHCVCITLLLITIWFGLGWYVYCVCC